MVSYLVELHKLKGDLQFINTFFLSLSGWFGVGQNKE
jgi:hypothetical protein